MNLQSLVLCSDDKIMRVLRRVLSDLEIGIEHCTDADSAVRKLTRKRFEAVIVDCHDEDMAAQVLSSVRSAPCNKRAVAVALIDGQKAVRSAFGLGAHFVLYKPISSERAKASFRAARALMKSERRRNTRIAIQIPVHFVSESGAGQRETVTTDLGEGGMAVRLAPRSRKAGSLRIKFALPGTDHSIECAAEVAWTNNGSQSGVRFVDLAPEQRMHLKAWLARHSSEIEPDDPPIPCKLTDLSLGACYLEMNAPFPVRTRVVLTMSIADLRLQVEGVVHVMHPEVGIGVEFTRATNQQRDHVEKFIQALMNSKGALPELLVEPEGMDDMDGESPSSARKSASEAEDPLLDLFRRSNEFTTESFLAELSRQRNSPSPVNETVLPIQ